MRTTLEAAAAMQVRSAWCWSRASTATACRARPRVAETHPREPQTRKGMYRKEQEDLVLEAHSKGQLDGLIVRLPDFYGPGADNSLANPIFRARAGGQDGQLGRPRESRRTNSCSCPIPAR